VISAAILSAFFQQHLQLAHHARALERRRVAPGREGGFGRGDGGLHRGLLASATLVVDWPVAGLNTGCVRSVSATIWPSIRWPTVAVTSLSWVGDQLQASGACSAYLSAARQQQHRRSGG
jgi:hypothetical protein